MGLALALASLGCGGTRGTSSSEIPTPAVHEMARLQEMGRLDPARLACSAVTLDIVARELGPHVPALAYAAPRPVVAEPSSHARSVQQEMAASDFRNMAARYASTQRVVAAQATQAGDNDRAALAGSYVARALRAASMSGADPVRLEERPIGWSQADAELLVEYTSLWSTVFLAEPGTEESALARVSQIGQGSPLIMEAYASLLLYTYRDPELVCAPSG
jgi:hypothetical protein